MYLNLVWHFHQPIYHLPDSKNYLLPWVNYHSTKNYWQMLKIIEEQEFQCTVNLVPCLVKQIKDYQTSQVIDPVLESLLKPAESLSDEEISRLKRWFHQSRSAASNEELQYQVLVSFFSPLLHPERKSREELLSLREEIFKQILEYFKRLKDLGYLEITATPYYHPLLPLLADLGQARPEAPDLPEFHHPEDALWQLQQTRQFFEEEFGFTPDGLWPSEGALSQAACELIHRAGYIYTMTDEHLLWKSLDHRPQLKLLYQPYECAGVKIIFRDRELSDLIGFEYHRWPAAEAVSALMRKLEKRAAEVCEEAICSIILDGENPWGSYQNNGIDFLRLLYEKIKAASFLRPVLPGHYLNSHQPEKTLTLVSGTWMSGFFKWVSHPEKVRTWKRLAEARSRNHFSEYLAVAEGSDWFWWAGETEEPEFEFLFSSYLEKAEGKK